MVVPWSPRPGRYELLVGDLQGELLLDRQPPGLAVGSVPTSEQPPESTQCQLALDMLAYHADGTLFSQTVGPSRGGYEHVHRQDKIFVTYRADSEHPIRLSASWRAGTTEQPDDRDAPGKHPMVDLHVEAQTDLNFGDFECLTQTALEAEQLWFLFGYGVSNEWIELRQWIPRGVQRVVFPRDAQAARLTYDGRCPELTATLSGPTAVAPLVVWRLPGGRRSYAEMCHVADGARLVLNQSAGDGGSQGSLLQSGFGLFGQDLEKGVILRGRVRGVWLARQGDLDIAAELFYRFLDEPPPLAS